MNSAADTPKLHQRLLADFALLLVNVIWGSTFIMVDTAVETVSVFVFVALRFSIAFIVLLIIFSYSLWKMKIKWSDVWKGMVIGLFLFVGYTFQTLGLQFGTEPGKAAFITGLSVVLVPIFAAFILRKAPHPLSWLGIIVALIGLGMLSLVNGFNFAAGEILGDVFVLIGAISFAFHIIMIDRFVATNHFIPLSIIQVGTTAFLSWIAVFASWKTSIPISFNNQVIFAMLFTGIIATALIISVQTFAQKKTSPTHVAVIFATEPVFGAIFAVALAGEILLWRQWGGAALIFASMIFQQLLDIYYQRKQLKQEANNDILEEAVTNENEFDTELVDPTNLEK